MSETIDPKSALHTVLIQLLKSNTPQDAAEYQCQQLNLAWNQPLDAQTLTQMVAEAYDQRRNRRFNLTEVGNAKRMATDWLGKILYIDVLGMWYKWNGRNWVPCTQVELEAMAKASIRSLHSELMHCIDDKERAELAYFIKQSETHRQITAMLNLVRSEPDITIRATDLDTDPFSLPVANGVLDLRSTTLQAHAPNLLVTRLIDIEFCADAHCPLWERFLADCMGDHADVLVPFIQRAIGYTLTGATHEQCFFFLHGVGANGKSTFINILRRLLGDFGTQAAAHTILEKRSSGNGPSSDIARLQGKRLVSVNEIAEGQRFNDALIKSITGGDELTARYLYKDEITFRPQLKLWVAANYKPGVSAMDEGMWRRNIYIPFEVTIPKEKRDPELEHKLIKELPGILDWAVKGCQAWQENGLQVPQIVLDATREYRNSADIVGMWLAEEAIIEPGASVRTTQALKSYQKWCSENGTTPMGLQRFKDDLLRRGFTYTSKGQSFYHGFDLLQTWGGGN